MAVETESIQQSLGQQEPSNVNNEKLPESSQFTINNNNSNKENNQKCSQEPSKDNHHHHHHHHHHNHHNNNCDTKEEDSNKNSKMESKNGDKELIDKLLRMVKREVKQIMEEAVTRKFVHEDSSSITALCAAVDACLANGLKRRALGLFKTNSTTALLQKVAKNCETANAVLKRVAEIEANDPSRRSGSGNSADSQSRTRLSFKLKGNTNNASVIPCSSNNATNNQCPSGGAGSGGGGGSTSTAGASGVTVTPIPGNNQAAAAGAAVCLSNGSPSTAHTYSGPFKPTRYLWIRVALFEKRLVTILDHVVAHADKYYERDALVSDPVAGQILASLLVGPCALDYSKMKTHDWADPPADELVQRHRITSTMTSGSLNTTNTPPGSRKPLGVAHYRRPLQYYSADSSDNLNSSSQQQAPPQCQQQQQQQPALHQHFAYQHFPPDAGSPLSRTSNICWSPRDYVESLHQNSRSQLLYGKNNVVMQPQGDLEPLPGYLSLHLEPWGLIIKWTPNQLINGRLGQSSLEIGDSLSSHSFDKSNIFLKYALNIGIENVVYLHCHQALSEGGSIVMVGRDGVMHPPIKFPAGGHLLSFLTCLEAGLGPWGQLDPPLWSEKGKGKVFPKLRRKVPLSGSNQSCCSESAGAIANENDKIHNNGDKRMPAEGDNNHEHYEEETAASADNTFGDYVFRIVWINDKPDTISPELFDGIERAEEASEDGITKNKTPKNDNKPVDDKCRDEKDKSELDTECLRQKIAEEDATEKANIQMLCDTMRKQIISRAFYGWLAYCRHLKTVRTHLADLVNAQIIGPDPDGCEGVTEEFWYSIQSPDDGKLTIDPRELNRRVYYGGIEHKIRAQVWPYLLGHYRFDDSTEEKQKYDEEMKRKYEMIMSDWLAVEAIVKQRDKEIVAANLSKLSSESTSASTSEFHFTKRMLKSMDENGSASNEVFDEEPPTTTTTTTTTNTSRKSSGPDAGDQMQKDTLDGEKATTATTTTTTNGNIQQLSVESEDDKAPESSGKPKPKLLRHRQVESVASLGTLSGTGSGTSSESSGDHPGQVASHILITNPSVDTANVGQANALPETVDNAKLPVNECGSACVSPASSNGGVYSNELLDLFSLNIHRIHKDVHRCDRNFWYFTKENLEKLQNVMCTYVWEHLDIGYVQGMCDLVAPLLVIFDDEVITFNCFSKLMRRMVANFPHGGAMDTHFANMRSLIQILDADVFEVMHQNGDYTHFYFCYRWFLLDFKREFVYADIFSVWETIWSAKEIASSSFVLFIALALVEYYRDIILENSMDFTDIIKFFNEMAERHDAKSVLQIARDLVLQIQTLIDK